MRTKHRSTYYKLKNPCRMSNGQKIRIALLSDTHNGPWEPVRDSLQSGCPDMICIAGDILYGGIHAAWDNQVNVLPLLRACARIAPTFLSLGNHDWALTETDLDRIGGLGVVVLDNRWVRHQGIFIGGLTSGIALKLRKSAWDGETASHPPQTDWLSAFQARQGYKILLCHHPEYYPRYLKGRSFDLVLSGHAHGGQWRFFDRGIYAPGQGLFPRLTSGVHGNLIISKGLANPSRIPRINNPTEVVYME